MAEYGSMTNNDIKNTLSSYSGIGSVAGSVPKMNKSKTKKPSYGASTTYTRPSYNVLSVQDALTQARSQLDPMKDLAVARVQESYEKEKNRLPQYLNARGQTYGGARIIGEQNLFDDSSKQINDINTQNNAQVASLAQQLVQRSQDRADSQAAQDFSQWATIQNMLENRYGNEMAQYNADRNYDYQTGRDLIGDQRYADELAYNRSAAEQSRADSQALNTYNQAVQRTELWGRVMNDADAQVLGIPKGTLTSDAAYKAASLAARSSGSGGEGNPVDSYSADVADTLINTMYSGYQNHGSSYNYKWVIDVAKNKGVWNKMTESDKARVNKALRDLAGKTKDKDSI